MVPKCWTTDGVSCTLQLDTTVQSSPGVFEGSSVSVISASGYDASLQHLHHGRSLNGQDVGRQPSLARD